eukprot:tig00020610_g12050.t1
MPRVLLVAVGPRGEVQGVAAVGVALRKTGGFEVCVAAHKDYKALVERHGLVHFEVGGDEVSALEKPSGRQLEDASWWNRDARTKGFLRPLMHEWWDGTLAAAKSWNPDILGLNTPASYYGPSIADILKIPYFVLFTIPMCPTSAFAPPIGYGDGQSRLKFLNGLKWKWFSKFQWYFLWFDFVNQRRKDNGLPALPLDTSPTAIFRTKNVPVMHLISSALIPKPLDWRPNEHIVGPSTLREAALYTPGPKDHLLQFLNAGEPPIYIGFGSAHHAIPGEGRRCALNEIFCDVLGNMGPAYRTVLQCDKKYLNCRIPPNVHPLTSPVPHDWLFPKCAAVICHGGAGTVQAALHAGRPVVVLPNDFVMSGRTTDQIFWGALVERLKVGWHPYGLKGFCIAKCQILLKALFANEEIKKAAESFGTRVRTEDGAAAAAAIVADRWGSFTSEGGHKAGGAAQESNGSHAAPNGAPPPPPAKAAPAGGGGVPLPAPPPRKDPAKDLTI